jgi:hypothetical protein
MKLKTIYYEIWGADYLIELPTDQAVIAVASSCEMNRQVLVTAIELGLFNFSDDPCSGIIKNASVVLDKQSQLEDPDKAAGKNTDLLGDHQGYQDHVLGRNPLDIIDYLRRGEYSQNVDRFLRRLSGGRMMGMKWDGQKGLLVQANGTTHSIFALLPMDLEILRLSARLVDILDPLRYPLQIVTGESLATLDHDHLVRFTDELHDLLQPEMQIILVCKLTDVLGSPLSGLPGLRIIELDDKGVPNEQN